MHIKIGEVETLRTENWDVTPNDRQERIEVIGGTVVQDFGIYDEVYSCKATVAAANASIVSGYAYDREFVDIRDTSGRILQKKRVVIKKYGYVEHFEKDYYWFDLEFWEV